MALRAVASALDRFLDVIGEIVALSRRNTNVRSLAPDARPPALWSRRACEDALRTIEESLAGTGRRRPGDRDGTSRVILSACGSRKMAEMSQQIDIPNRSLFKAAEVCDLARVQPYVLRSWEAEFKDLGVSKSGSTSRVYRREDVERVLRIRHLLLVEGLTLAGVRRRLEEEAEPPLAERAVHRGTACALARGDARAYRRREAWASVAARSARRTGRPSGHLRSRVDG